MAPVVSVRAAVPADAVLMAAVHVSSWRQTYRGLMSDSVLDDPGLLAARERFWTGALTDERWSSNRVAVAEAGGDVIGIAMSGPPLDADATWTAQLHVLYVDSQHHGSGAGQALLQAVLDPRDSAAWWVAEQNPRARSFMRRNGFVPDEHSRVEEGLRVVRWIRPAGRAGRSTAR